MALAMLAAPFAAFGQTRIAMPRNKYKPEDDVKLGQQTSVEAEKQLKVLNDPQLTSYLQSVGERLVNAIPPEYQHSEFRYSFKVVNDKSINAFALPGGPMYVNTGMIVAAKNEGEMAGVMAHELSHVALRHGTAQQTKLTSAGNQILGIGAILGGAVLGGQQGAELGAGLVQIHFLKFSREYETQADVLGSQIMARAGYDPRDLANMFKTIEGQGGGKTPEFLSDHPNPENRYQRINQEAALLQVNNNPIKITRGFENAQARVRGGRVNSQIAQNGQTDVNANGSATGNYSRSIAAPSTRYRNYNANIVSLDVPDNFQQTSDSGGITFAPQGAFGAQGITHGALIGTVPAAANSRANLAQATQSYISGLLQSEGNNYLQQSGSSSRTTIDGRNALQTTLAGRSPITGQTELVNIYTVQTRDGGLLYIATVSPQADSSRYRGAFSQMLRSLQIND